MTDAVSIRQTQSGEPGCGGPKIVRPDRSPISLVHMTPIKRSFVAARAGRRARSKNWCRRLTLFQDSASRGVAILDEGGHSVVL